MWLVGSAGKWTINEDEPVSRWWFQILFIFTPIWARFPIWLYNIIRTGWNHQLGNFDFFLMSYVTEITYNNTNTCNCCLKSISTFSIKSMLTQIRDQELMTIHTHKYGTPPPKTHTFSEFTGICAILLLFTMFKCLFFFWCLFYIFKKLCRVVKTLPPLIKLFSLNRKGFLQNLEKTKKQKKQNFLEKFGFQVKRCFFLVFLEFFCFFLV